MKLIQWTFFIDMLGYSDINGGIDSEEKATEFVDFMQENKNIFESTDSDYIRKVYENDRVFDFYKFYEIKYAFISDSFILTYYPKEFSEEINEEIYYNHSANALFIAAMRMQAFIYHCFKEKKIFLRGGISNKYCYIKDGFAVGEGLIEAYKAESSLAISPRILLDPSIMKNSKLANGINFISKYMYKDRGIISSDKDGSYFIDYIGYSISCVDSNIPMIFGFKNREPKKYWTLRGVVEDFIKYHKETVSEKIAEMNTKVECVSHLNDDKIKMEKIRDKYIWLKKYHNSKIRNSDFSYLLIE